MNGEEKTVYIRNKILEKLRKNKKTISDVSSYSGIDIEKIRNVFENPSEDIETLISIASAMKVSF